MATNQEPTANAEANIDPTVMTKDITEVIITAIMYSNGVDRFFGHPYVDGGALSTARYQWRESINKCVDGMIKHYNSDREYDDGDYHGYVQALVNYIRAIFG